jgi:hypothetical protein
VPACQTREKPLPLFLYEYIALAGHAMRVEERRRVAIHALGHVLGPLRGCPQATEVFDILRTEQTMGLFRVLLSKRPGKVGTKPAKSPVCFASGFPLIPRVLHRFLFFETAEVGSI